MTVIELMVVLIIVAILAGIALPSYQDSIRKSGRSAAKGALMDMVMRQEQYFLNNKSYSASLDDLGLPDPYFVTKSSEQVAATDTRRIYKMTLANATATSYDVVATAVNKQSSDSCGNYTLKSDGSKSVSGSAGNTACW